MSRLPRVGVGARVAGLVALALFAVAPFLGQAHATSAEDDLVALVGRLREFRAQVRGGELTRKGVNEQAKRIIALKRDFVVTAEEKTGVHLEPYLDLAIIDRELAETKRHAFRIVRSEADLRAAVAAARELIGKLFGRADTAAYQPVMDCFEDFESSIEVLLHDMRSGPDTGGAGVPPHALRERVDELSAAESECIAAWPATFGVSFTVVHALLRDVDHALDGIADPQDDPKGDVLVSLGRAVAAAKALLAQVEQWAGGSPSPGSTTPRRTPTPGISPTSGTSPSPVQTASPTALPSQEPSPSQEPTPAQEPTPEESPSGINPRPPSMSRITAVFDAEGHVTRYSITASDPDNDELTFTWTKSPERDCGTFNGSGRNATWDHGEPPCPDEQPHPGTITVFVSDGTYTCSALYEGGSASGSGPPADCGLAPRP